MYSTKSFNINIIRNAVEEFNARFTGFGTVSVLPTHINEAGGAMGVAQSESFYVVDMVERIISRREGEEIDRNVRQAILWNQLEAGIISEEVFDREYSLSF